MFKQNHSNVPRNVYFSSWTRKRFAVFQTLGKQIKICTLLATYTIVSMPLNAQSKSDSVFVPEQVDIDEVVVSSSHEAQLSGEVARSVSSITSKEIGQSGSFSLNAITESLPSIDLRQRGPFDIQADLGINGGTHNQSLILINGINFNNPQTGHHNLNLPVSLPGISKIELLSGGASRIWGPWAYSGAVNFITKPNAANNYYQLAVNYGQYNTFNLEAAINQHVKNTYHLLTISQSTSDGYIKNTDFNNTRLFYINSYKAENSEFNLSLGYQKKDFGATNFYASRYPWQHEITEGLFSALQYQTGGRIRFKSNMYMNLHTDRFELFRETADYFQRQGDVYVMNNDTARYYGSTYNYPGHNYHYTQVFGNSGKLYFPTYKGSLVVGVKSRTEKVFSNVLGYNLEKPIKVSGSNAFYTKNITRSTYCGFVEKILTFRKLNIAMGVLVNWNTDYKLKPAYFPGIDFGYQLTNSLKVMGSVNKSTRYPSFTELFYYDGVSQGSTQLKPEEAYSYEASVNYNKGNLHANIKGFYISEKNAIDFLLVDSSGLFTATNISAFEKAGFSSGIKYYFTFSTWLNTARLSVYYNSITKNTYDYQARYSVDHLRFKATAALNHNITDKLSINYQLYYHERDGVYEALQPDGSLMEKSFQPVFLTNIGLFYQLKKYQVYCKIDNVFDQTYIDYGNIQQPGIWLMAGLKLEIG